MPRPPSAVERALLRLALLVLAAFTLAIAGGEPARAQSCTAGVTDGDFGTPDGLAGGTVDTTATLTFSCTGLTPGIPVTLCPSIGAGSAGGDGSGGRYLAQGASTVPFQIYQNGGRTLTWGSTAFLIFGDVPTITSTPGGNGKVNVTRTLYGRATIPANAKPGEYKSDFAAQTFFWGLNILTCGTLTVGYAIPPPTFSFKVNVQAGCSVSATQLSFGSLGVLSATTTSSNTVSVRCTPTTPYTVGLNNGLNGTSPTDRKMAKGAERVTYGIYKDDQGAQPWGEVAQGLSFVRSGTGSGSAQTYTAYGRLPAQQTPSPGSYSDTVVTTVTY